MRAWSRPAVPAVAGEPPVPSLHDTSTGSVRPAECAGDGRVGLYVCGITPYDATHLGHASTYLAFDTLQRVWLDRGYDVAYVQNVTDVDDPLLERATATGVDWRDLAAEQVELFRTDMEALRILPPDSYVGVTEVVDEVAAAVAELVRRGTAYPVDTPDAAEPGARDLYFDVAGAGVTGPWTLGDESGYDRATMAVLSAERGGDPERPGKRDPLDPLLWRAERAGEPAWDSVVGRGRPGWHIECAVIALRKLDRPVTVQGGGSDLIFPHHEMSAGHAAALTGEDFACVYAHTGMVAYQGEKMSKSLGNLVLVSRLRTAGVDPRAIRLALLAQHYRADWEWTDALLEESVARLTAWDAWAAEAASGDAPALEDAPGELVQLVRERLADDLDTPGAILLLDLRVATDVPATPVELDAVDALLGVRLGSPAA
ncbi:cysteine--1-D-myo-inosityl 2-amino-2-deoxy-alpha-D-glucopyranoside ligase [Clavibacter sp. km3a]|uniref:cysteine--1-D-myo-inosityl 2-amino-2-deoxy-alpha-D-glucopyranoside ligase n=1 Tax=Clavibacter sp. km3a TaxID=3459135 RepID=UPI004042F1F9